MKLRLIVASALIVCAVGGAMSMLLGPFLNSIFQMVRAAPALSEPLEAWRKVLPLLMGLDFIVALGLTFLILYVVFGIPLGRAEASVERIARETSTYFAPQGPLFVRLDTSLRRLSQALNEEREGSKAQLNSLKASHDALARLQAELVAADRLATVGKLAAGVAHEVGNPLSGILGYLSVVRMRAKDSAELHDVVDRIEAEVRRIDQIVRALLELGRPSRGRAQPVDVRPVVESCIQLLGAGHDFRELKIEVAGPSSVWLCAESGPLSQVLINLLMNAAQATGGKGRVTVRLVSEADRGWIAVEDDGPGLAPDVLKRLFEPFFTTKPAGHGTGLGLAVSKHLLSQFDGTLTAHNRPEGGAAFRIGLPAP